MYWQVPPEKWSRLTPDSDQYAQASSTILKNFDFDTHTIKKQGPGYPAFLALAGWRNDDDSIRIILIQIILGAFSSVLIAKLALQLGGARNVAFIAGMAHSLSPAAISLSNILLTECLFVFLMLSGFTLALGAFKSSNPRQFILVGLLFAMAALVRSTGVMLYGIFGVLWIGWCLQLTDAFVRCLRRTLPGVLTATAVWGLILGSYLLYNYNTIGVAQISLAGSGGLKNVICVVEERTEQLPFQGMRDRFDDSVKARMERSNKSYVYEFTHLANEKTSYQLSHHRDVYLAVCYKNIIDNVHNDFELYTVQTPVWKNEVNAVRAYLGDHKLHFRTSVLALLGLLYMIWRRQYLLASFTVTIFLYFALTSAFSYWQTSRIIYPATPAISIFTASVIVAVWDVLMKIKGITRKMKPLDASASN